MTVGFILAVSMKNYFSSFTLFWLHPLEGAIAQSSSLFGSSLINMNSKTHFNVSPISKMRTNSLIALLGELWTSPGLIWEPGGRLSGSWIVFHPDKLTTDNLSPSLLLKLLNSWIRGFFFFLPRSRFCQCKKDLTRTENGFKIEVFF